MGCPNFQGMVHILDWKSQTRRAWELSMTITSSKGHTSQGSWQDWLLACSIFQLHGSASRNLQDLGYRDSTPRWTWAWSHQLAVSDNS